MSCIPLCKFLAVEWLNCMASDYLIFLKTASCFSKVYVLSTPSSLVYGNSSCSQGLGRDMYFVSYYSFTLYLTIVLLCISLVIGDIEHLFICFIHMPFLGKYLFTFLVHFLNWVCLLIIEELFRYSESMPFCLMYVLEIFFPPVFCLSFC